MNTLTNILKCPSQPWVVTNIRSHLPITLGSYLRHINKRAFTTKRDQKLLDTQDDESVEIGYRYTKNKKRTYVESFHKWKHVLAKTHRDYIDSFEGFFSNHVGKDEESIKTEGDIVNDSNKFVMNKVDKVKENLSKNIETIEQEGSALMEDVKKNTGIHNKDDLKEAASSMMVLATESISQFISGYKKGRDEEVDKMLNHYFVDNQESNQDVEKKEKPKERKLFRKKRRKALRN